MFLNKLTLIFVFCFFKRYFKFRRIYVFTQLPLRKLYYRFANIRFVFYVPMAEWSCFVLFFSYLFKIDDVAGERRLLTGNNESNDPRIRINPTVQKLSITSSVSSTEHSNFCVRVYQKCQMICCICTPRYL